MVRPYRVRLDPPDWWCSRHGCPDACTTLCRVRRVGAHSHIPHTRIHDAASCGRNTMPTTTSTKRVPTPRRGRPAVQQTAMDLLRQLAATPADDPQRPTLRSHAIEA